jgi:hypothetical protein
MGLLTILEYWRSLPIRVVTKVGPKACSYEDIDLGVEGVRHPIGIN